MLYALKVILLLIGGFGAGCSIANARGDNPNHLAAILLFFSLILIIITKLFWSNV